MRWIKRLALLVLLLAILAAGALFLIPTDRIAGVAARQFEAATGRSLPLSGDLSPTRWPVLGVTAGPVEIANADWSDEGPMIRAEGLVIGLQAMPLVSGRIELRELRIDRPQILLERHADGRTNWNLGDGRDTGSAASEGGSGGGVPDLQVTIAEITDGLVRYVDHGSGEEIVFSDTDLRIRMPDAAGEARLEASARLNGVPVTLGATLDGPGPLIDGAVRPVKADLTAAGNSIAFDGRAGMSPAAADGRLDADLPELAVLMALAGQTAPDLPAGLGRERVTLSGTVTLTDGDGLFLRDGTIGLDSNRLRAEADLALGGARPRLVGRLSAETLDLSGLAAGEGGGAAGDAGAGGWPTEPIDVSGLGAADAEVSLAAGGISFGDFAIGATDLVARLDNSRLATEIRNLSAFDGQLSGEVVVNGRSGLSVGGDLTATGMQLRPMLTALADYDRLLGPVEARLNFLGSGASVDAIMRGLSGEGRIDIGQGELQGLDIAGMLRNLDTSYRGPGAKTIFNAITGSFTVAQGVLRNDDLNFDAPLVPATGKGQVDIGRKTVKYRLTPVALGSRGDEGVTGGVRVPVLIEGSWSDPSIRPDLENMLEGEIDARREDVEQRVQEEIGKQLGLEAVEGEKVDDTLKRGIEEKAKGALKGLLGGGQN